MPNLRFTLKAWPVITAVTIGLCFATQGVAKLLGVDLPDQANIALVRRAAGWNLFFVFLCAQVVILMPAIEELLFRGLLYKLPAWHLSKKHAKAPRVIALLSSALFSAAHYLFQPWPDAAFIALAFFGFAQCWLYRKTNHIWCAMLNHALFNLTNLVLLFILPQ